MTAADLVGDPAPQNGMSAIGSLFTRGPGAEQRRCNCCPPALSCLGYGPAHTAWCLPIQQACVASLINNGLDMSMMHAGMMPSCWERGVH